MCLINFQFHEHPNYKLIVAANRDEFYNRSTASAHFWEDEPDILAGRDLLGMGQKKVEVDALFTILSDEEIAADADLNTSNKVPVIQTIRNGLDDRHQFNYCKRDRTILKTSASDKLVTSAIAFIGYCFLYILRIIFA